MKTMLLLLPVLFAALLPGSALAEDAAAPAEEIRNETCPVMEGEKVDPNIFVDYEGKRVYFCCESCVDDFKADPTAYLHNLPQFADSTGRSSAADRAAGAAAPAANPREKHPLGGLHPILVHFPVALTMVAFLAYLVSLLIAGKFLRNFATLTIVIAAAMSVPAYLMGEEAEEALGQMAEARHERVETHADWGTISMYALLGVAAFTLVSRFLPDSGGVRLVVLLALLGAAGVIGYTGYLGGEVVRPGHLQLLF